MTFQPLLDIRTRDEGREIRKRNREASVCAFCGDFHSFHKINKTQGYLTRVRVLCHYSCRVPQVSTFRTSFVCSVFVQLLAEGGNWIFLKAELVQAKKTSLARHTCLGRHLSWKLPTSAPSSFAGEEQPTSFPFV